MSTGLLRRWASAGILILMTAHLASARILYVAKSGDDSWPGSSQQPWATIAKAASTARAGDTVYIKTGTYAERLIPANSGTAQSPILFSAHGSDLVTLDGKGLGGQGVVYINGRSHMTIARFRIINGNETGIWIINSSHIRAYGNHTYNTVSSGIIVSEFGVNSHVYIDSNKVELACNDGGQECISISKCTVFEVTRNEVFNGGPGTHGGEGIDVKFGSSKGIVAYNYVHHLSRQGLYADAWTIATSDVEFYGNIVHDCQFGLGAASEQGGTLTNIIFHNNLVYDCEGPGMYILMSAGPMRDIHFVNNTIHRTGTKWGSGMWFNGPQATGVVVRNNIFSGLSGQPFFVQAAPAGWTVDHNLAATAQAGQASGFIIGTPQYVNSASGDFRLMSGSPGIDAGSAQTIYDTKRGDLTGAPRVQDGNCDNVLRIDIGAYEFKGQCAPVGVRPERASAVPSGRSPVVPYTIDTRGRVIGREYQWQSLAPGGYIRRHYERGPIVLGLPYDHR